MFRSDEPSLSSPQKLASPTFHTPFSRTATPVAPLATDWPAAVRSYFTFACVPEVSVTESTLADTADASGLLENAETAAAKEDPFCRSSTRLLLGVDELKNASQFALICAVAGWVPAPDVPLADGLFEVGTAGDDVAPGVLVVLGLVEHAATAAASARPSAGASKIRRAT
jgi:hypothetical protein